MGAFTVSITLIHPDHHDRTAQVDALVDTGAMYTLLPAEIVAEFSTTLPGLVRLADWLDEHGVEKVAMEATGDYWKPVWAVLEERFALMLVNAQHVKQAPGRKTDISDAVWLC